MQYVNAKNTLHALLMATSTCRLVIRNPLSAMPRCGSDNLLCHASCSCAAVVHLCAMYVLAVVAIIL